MIENIAMGLCVMVLCLLVQAILVAIAVRFYARHRNLILAPTIGSTVMLISGVMLVLVLGNFLQVSIWALLFVYLGEFQDYGVAAYHSAVNFATLGYGDIVMSDQHRVLGPVEAINGVLMIGVSTAVLMSAIQDALKTAYQGRVSTPDAAAN